MVVGFFFDFLHLVFAEKKLVSNDRLSLITHTGGHKHDPHDVSVEACKTGFKLFLKNLQGKFYQDFLNKFFWGQKLVHFFMIQKGPLGP